MKNRYTILLLIVGVGIMLAMLYFIGLEDVLSALAMSNLYLVLLAILVQIFTYYLYTFRWYLINESAGINKGVRELLPMVMVSLAVNNLTPSGRGGGEPVRAYILSKNSEYHFKDTFATVVADRAMDTFPFLLLAIVTIIGIIFSFKLATVWIVIFILAVAAITALVAIIIYMCVNEAFGDKLIGWIIRLVRRFYKNYSQSTEDQIVDSVRGFQKTMNFLLRDKKVLYYALPLSFVIWGMEIFRVYLVFLAFGANVSFISIGEVFIVATLVGMIPLLPGGLGAIDGVMILLYANAGITASVSAAATVIERLISFWMATIIGLFIMPMYGGSLLEEAMGKVAANKELDDSSKKQDAEVLSESVDSIDSVDDSMDSVSGESVDSVSGESVGSVSEESGDSVENAHEEQ